MEYYDEQGLKELFQHPDKMQRGILQRFIEPYGEKNCNTLPFL
jgi:hypothetical protein